MKNFEKFSNISSKKILKMKNFEKFSNMKKCRKQKKKQITQKNKKGEKLLENYKKI